MHSDILKVVVSAVGRHLRLVSDLYKVLHSTVVCTSSIGMQFLSSILIIMVSYFLTFKIRFQETSNTSRLMNSHARFTSNVQSRSKKCIHS